jgi:phospholipid/cholesterol/gamma-HCH transport system ATP-binding protein
VALNAIEFKNVSLDFGTHSVLSKVNFTIPAGKKYVLIGPSGQGKSSILKIIAGLVSPTFGEVLVNGQDWKKLKGQERKSLQQRIGMLFQNNALFDSLTVGENVAFPLREVKGGDENDIQSKVDEFLEAVGLIESKQLSPNEISGGMQKRLGIARALALNPELILYDDPTAGLDPITSRKIIDLILKIQKENRSTVLAVTNDMNRAYQLADDIIFVNNEEIIETGSPQMTKQHSHQAVYHFVRGLVQA